MIEPKRQDNLQDSTQAQAAPSQAPQQQVAMTWVKRLGVGIGTIFGKHKAPVKVVPIKEKSANELAADRTDLATERTLMAADRSLMAWVRTALSMISFGFTIYKLLQGFAEGGAEFGHASSPRFMGMVLTGMGTVAMVFGTVEYWYRLVGLRAYRHYPLWRPSFVMAVLMSAIGLFLFVAIISKAL